VLAYKHYPALERRLHKIMGYVLECMDKQSGGLGSMVSFWQYFDNRFIPIPIKKGDDRIPQSAGT
jgi:hypothetical protein